MKFGLTPRLVASHTIVALAAALVFAAVLIGTTGQQAMETGVGIDRATAYRLAPWVEEYLQRTGSLEGLEKIIVPQGREALPPIIGDDRIPQRMPMMPMMRTAPMLDARRTPPPAQLLDRPILIIDRTGTPLLQRDITPQSIPPGLSPDDGVPIRFGRREELYLFVGGMIEEERNPLSALFYRSMVRAAALTGVSVLLLVTGMSALWVRLFLRPVREVQGAAAALARGESSRRASLPRGEHELTDLARTFNTMADEIEAQEKSRLRFVGDAAHELRTPISLVATRIEMLRAGIYTTDDGQWSSLAGDVKRIHHLVDDLQTLARADAGRLTLTVDLHPLDALISESQRHLTPAADSVGVSIVVTPGEARLVTVDPERFGQIMVNILGNALRYSPRGARVTIESNSVAPDPTFVEIAIEDEGPGIPPAERERIFQRFVRLDDGRARSDGGSGLGLAITAELVRMHGGRIRAESPHLSEHGARVVFTLPASRRDLPAH